jgi:glycosyl transferase family 2
VIGPHVLGVVVPVRNEDQLLAACLAGIDRASGRVRQPVVLVVVLDACTDRSAAVLAGCQLTSVQRLVVLSSDRGNVGYARDLGMRWLLREFDMDGLWLATTDADSVVPPHWLTGILWHAAQGSLAVLGTVEVPDWTGHPPHTRPRYLGGYRSADGHRHVHGANLSLAAAAYLAAGGFPQLAADEDVMLVRRLVGLGLPVAWVGDLPVATSSRLVGRAPAGFAQHLRSLSASDPRQQPRLGRARPAAMTARAKSR